MAQDFAIRPSVLIIGEARLIDGKYMAWHEHKLSGSQNCSSCGINLASSTSLSRAYQPERMRRTFHIKMYESNTKVLGVL
jgi:hypothetical protein